MQNATGLSAGGLLAPSARLENAQAYVYRIGVLHFAHTTSPIPVIFDLALRLVLNLLLFNNNFALCGVHVQSCLVVKWYQSGCRCWRLS